MAFAAKLGAGETVWDPTAGTGNVLAEVLALAPDAALVATDVDAAALGALERRLPPAAKPWTRVADAAAVELPTKALSLTIANLPFGRRYVAEGGNAAFYAGVLANSLKHAEAGWRGVFLTSDAAALRDAARRAGLAATVVADIKVRGLPATLWRIERPDASLIRFIPRKRDQSFPADATLKDMDLTAKNAKDAKRRRLVSTAGGLLRSLGALGVLGGPIG